MFLTNQNDDKIRIFLPNGAATTHELPFVSDYVDITTTAYTPGRTVNVTSGSTEVDLVPVVSNSSTQRQVKGISVYNYDTVSQLVNVDYYDGDTSWLIMSVTLSVGDRLDYTDTNGWRVIDNTGHVKMSTGTVSGPGSTTDNQIALFSGSAGTIIKAATNTGILKAASGVIASAGVGDADLILPTQTGNADKFLQTNGAISSWVDTNLIKGSGQATVDFGLPTDAPSSLTTVTVLASWVTSGSIIMCTVADITTTYHTPGDAQADGITAYVTNIQNGVSFDIEVSAMTPTYGDYRINYIGV